MERLLSMHPVAVKARAMRAAKAAAKQSEEKAAVATGAAEVPNWDILAGIKALLDAQDAKVQARIDAIESRMAQLSAPPAGGQHLSMHSSQDLDKFLERLTAEEQQGKLRSPGEQSEGIKDVKDFANPWATQTGFQPRDIVALKRGTEKEKKFREWAGKNGENIPDTRPIYGQILQFMFVSKKTAGWQGQKLKPGEQLRKYKVNFPGFGKDGVMEDEIELVKPAA